MICNDRFFNYPPYLSLGWDQVSALKLEKDTTQLTFILKHGQTVTLPPLTEKEIAEIFKAHLEYLERQAFRKRASFGKNLLDEGDSSVKFLLGTQDGLQSAAQHDPSQKDAPNLPEEILSKIAQISKILGAEEAAALPKPEPHCNCFHCQIARAMRGEEIEELAIETVTAEEDISEKDLSFQEWNITQVGDKLYSVVNKLDPHEQYSVYLGHPVGCTCGKSGCEHILSVLKS